MFPKVHWSILEGLMLNLLETKVTWAQFRRAAQQIKLLTSKICQMFIQNVYILAGSMFYIAQQNSLLSRSMKLAPEVATTQISAPSFMFFKT